jgi:hypothetical protein
MRRQHEFGPGPIGKQRSSARRQRRCGWRRLVSLRASTKTVASAAKLAGAWAGAAVWAACARLPPASLPAPAPDPLSALREFENETRSKLDFAHAQTSETTFGPDPYVLRAAPWADRDGRPHLLGLLRGRSALVELDGSLREVARLPAPESPTGLAFGTGGQVFVVGELSSRVDRYARVRGVLEPAGFIDLPGVRAMRDIAAGPEGVLYVVEEHDGRLITIAQAFSGEPALPRARVDAVLCHGPLHVLRRAKALLVDCLLDHTLIVRQVDARGYPVEQGEVRITHDGPMWGFDAIDDGDSLVVAAGGVEDHPLDRTQGSFGFVDSFATVYRIAHGHLDKLREENTSALGLVTPKALALSRDPKGRLELAVAAYGSDGFAVLDVDGKRPTITSHIPPGSATLERLSDGTFVIANPLLDAWVRRSPVDTAVVLVPDGSAAKRSIDSRLGEALFFTTLIAPWDSSEGRLSRFTCETCHFEGYVDGRTHYTGRGDVRATTKPLLGLFNNRPHFSRALDRDMTTMVQNEFRVAGANSGHDPWFSLRASDVPWGAELFAGQAEVGPEALRRALMTFFIDFSHRPNPSVVGRSEWSVTERAGAAVFRDRCESCHEARLIADDASSRVPFERWEGLVMSPGGAIVWAHSDYEKTGVLPYVNEAGARVVSLRRLYKKYPYFTNGSARGLSGLLDRARLGDGRFFHDGEHEGTKPLSPEEKVELLAFLDLL